MAMDQKIKIDALHLSELVSRLGDRRVAVERELSMLGEPSKGMNDIFRHCRGFERAYSTMLQEAATSFRIRGVVEGLLPQALHGIAIEKEFHKTHVREICRRADGYQSHLVSPEKGLRRLVAEAMTRTEAHVHRFVDEIHIVLTETVVEAARRSVHAEHGVHQASVQDMEFLRLKGFENAVVAAASKALEEWKAEAHGVADTMVRMECDYVTPSFFRELEREHQAARLASAQGAEGAEGEEGGEGLRGDESDDGEGGASSSGRAPGAPGPGAAGGPSAGAPSGAPSAAAAAPGDIKSGWLEKRKGDAGALPSLPLESARWQKRWFVLTPQPAFLYYFASPEDMNSRGVQPKIAVPLAQCVVEDLAAHGGGPQAALLIRVSHVNPQTPVAKNNHSLLLRAGDAQEKADWLARLKGSAAGGGGGGARAPPARPAGAAPPPAGAAPAAGARSPERGLFGRGLAAVTGGINRMRGIGDGRVPVTIEAGSVEDMDTYYERLGTYVGAYARSAYTRMAKTVPKAIILCQVIRSRDQLLDQLYTYLSSLAPAEIERLLAEDPAVVRRRSSAQVAVKELVQAHAEVRALLEAWAGVADVAARQKAYLVPVRLLLLAGAFPLVPANCVPPGVNPARIYGESTPVALALPSGAPPPALAPPLKDGPERDEGGAGTPRASAAPGTPNQQQGGAQAAGAKQPRRAAPPPPPRA